MKGIEAWMLTYLLNSIWQVPLLFGAGWIAARAIRGAGTGAEHRVWVSVLVMQATLPVCSTVPWEWARELFAWGGGTQRPAVAGVSVVMGAGSGVGALLLPPALLAAIAIAYGGTAAYFAARFVFRWRTLSALRMESRALVLTGQSARDWAQCAQRFGVNDVLLATSSKVFGPITMGLTKKLVLLPKDMVARLSETDLRTVIAHEFAHMKRNDFRKNLIYELLSLPVSYHPLLSLTRARIMESREMICDQMAAETAGRNEYARSLLRLASLLVKGMPISRTHAIGIFDANTFERRVMKLSGEQKDVKGVRRLALVAVCAALGLATCGSALALSLSVDTDSVANQGKDAKAAGQVNVSAKVMTGNLLHKVPPQYPVEAKKARIQGKVVLEAIIGKDGVVENLKALSGPTELQQSALDAVKQWTYKPFLLNGNPVEVVTTVNVIYTLGK
jgi:TonB family protein